MPDSLDHHDRSGADDMDRTIPLNLIGEQHEFPVEKAIEKLREENAQLRDLVVQLTTIVVRNVLERK
jgi:hypothetical protein